MATYKQTVVHLQRRKPWCQNYVIFDEYQYAYETLFKNRDTSEWERTVSDLDQELPGTKEWSSFLVKGGVEHISFLKVT